MKLLDVVVWFSFPLVIFSVLIIYPHRLNELHVCIMSKGNDVNFFIDTNWSN
jgi:hypothetical protein